MQPRFRFHGGISGGGELARRDIDALAKQGFRSIFDLREEGEPGQTLSPNVAATWAHACGLEHRRLAVSVEHLEPRLVDLFLQTLAELPRPVYVHSQSGRRAATFLTIKLALDRGLDAPGALAASEAAGFPRPCASLERFLRVQLQQRAPEPQQAASTGETRPAQGAAALAQPVTTTAR